MDIKTIEFYYTMMGKYTPEQIEQMCIESGKSSPKVGCVGKLLTMIIGSFIKRQAESGNVFTIEQSEEATRPITPVAFSQLCETCKRIYSDEQNNVLQIIDKTPISEDVLLPVVQHLVPIVTKEVKDMSAKAIIGAVIITCKKKLADRLNQRQNDMATSRMEALRKRMDQFAEEQEK